MTRTAVEDGAGPRDPETERAELLKRLVDALCSLEITPREAQTIADLWIRRTHLLTQDIEGELWAAFVFGYALRDLQSAEKALNPKLRVIYDRQRDIVDRAGLSNHNGWVPPPLDKPSIDLGSPIAKSLPNCSARMMQWAVGQGGFWTTSGVYRSQGSRSPRTFEIVFDCGSSTAGALTSALNTYQPTGGVVDYLFLSHLDQDHTSGVETLLRRHRIDTVVMPLLSPAATLLASARLAAQDALSLREQELLTAPGQFFRERGVRRVMLVQSAPEEIGGDIWQAPRPPPPAGYEGAVSIGSSQEFVDSNGQRDASMRPFAFAEIVPHATTFWLLGRENAAFWQLTPYVHPFDPLRVGRFMQSAYKLLDAAGPSTSANSKYLALKSLLSSTAGVRDLKRLYKLVKSDHNSVSLSLFSCPCPRRNGQGRLSLTMGVEKGATREIHLDPPRLGWLHTGDSTLALESYRRAWMNYFGPVLDRVAVLVAPHHGSRHNFHRELLTVPAPAMTLACASRTNRYGHPAATLAQAARAARVAYHQVDEQADNAVVGHYSD